MLECGKYERYAIQNVWHYLFQYFLHASATPRVWEAPLCAQLTKASPMTIACETEELFSFLYMPTQRGHTIVFHPPWEWGRSPCLWTLIQSFQINTDPYCSCLLGNYHDARTPMHGVLNVRDGSASLNPLQLLSHPLMKR